MFVKRKPAFDVVVDGLNVANMRKDKSKLSETVRKQAWDKGQNELSEIFDYYCSTRVYSSYSAHSESSLHMPAHGFTLSLAAVSSYKCVSPTLGLFCQ